MRRRAAREMGSGPNDLTCKSPTLAGRHPNSPQRNLRGFAPLTARSRAQSSRAVFRYYHVMGLGSAARAGRRSSSAQVLGEDPSILRQVSRLGKGFLRQFRDIDSPDNKRARRKILYQKPTSPKECCGPQTANASIGSGRLGHAPGGGDSKSHTLGSVRCRTI